MTREEEIDKLDREIGLLRIAAQNARRRGHRFIASEYDADADNRQAKLYHLKAQGQQVAP